MLGVVDDVGFGRVTDQNGSVFFKADHTGRNAFTKGIRNDFDFATADKLVCTELVYRAFDGMLQFELVRVLGRQTLPATEIARKFVKEREGDDRQLDFTLFVDANHTSHTPARASEMAFLATVETR